MRGVRIFDITDIAAPARTSTNVQTCRGSHTHTVLVDPKDKDNVYVYVSGSGRRPLAQRTAGLLQWPCRMRTRTRPCSGSRSSRSRWRIRSRPRSSAHPRIFNDLAAPPSHGAEPGGQGSAGAGSKARGAFIVTIVSRRWCCPTGSPTHAAGQRGEGPRRHRRPDRGRQRGPPGRPAGPGRQAHRRRGQPARHRPEPVP